MFGFSFNIVPSDIDESRHSDESPPDTVLRLACEKAQKVVSEVNGLVLAADTIVADGDELLGKPVDQADAKRMLLQLRGRVHQVYTGIALIDSQTGESYDDVCRTDVPMRAYTDAEIDAYLATGDPMDKAGAYAIQHPGFHPVENLSGCYASVMGLPICRLIPGLRQFGLEIPKEMPQRCEAYLDYRCPELSKEVGAD